MTGIAGPGGGRPDKPVGTGVSLGRLRMEHVETKRFRGDRDRVRTLTVGRALDVFDIWMDDVREGRAFVAIRLDGQSAARCIPANV